MIEYCVARLPPLRCVARKLAMVLLCLPLCIYNANLGPGCSSRFYALPPVDLRSELSTNTFFELAATVCSVFVPP